MSIRPGLVGAALLCACDLFDGTGQNTSADHSDGSLSEASVDASSDAPSHTEDAAAIDGTGADAEPPIDDAGFPEHWSDRCGGAAVSRPFYRYHFSTRSLSGSAPACGSLAAGGPAKWMALRVEAGESVALRVASDPGGPAVTVRAFEACGGACVALRTRHDDDGSTLAWWRNPDASAHTIHVAVGAGAPEARGTFWFSPRIGATGLNATCATAGSTGGLFSGPVSSVGEETASCGTLPGPSTWYSLHVPSGSRVIAQSSSSGSITDIGFADLHLFAACGGACLRPAATSIDWVNEAAATVVVPLAVTARDPLDSRGVATSVQVIPAPENARCEGAIELPVSVPARESWSLSAAPSCITTPGERALFYRAHVGAGETLHVSGPTGTSQQRFAVIAACGGACLGAATSDATWADARWTNTSSAARDVWVAATGVPANSLWEHSMGSTVGAPANHATCATALRVSNGTTLTGERPLLTAGSAPCGATRETGAYYYSARVGAGETLSISGRGRFRALDGCDAARCLDLGGSTWRDNGLAWRNDGASARDVIVAVSLPRERQHESLDLSVVIGVQPYAMERITAQCEPTDGAHDARFTATYLGSTGSVWQALPFELPYFGETMRAWRLASPGGVRLDGAATPSMVADNAPLRPGPTTLPISGEQGLLAPLIDQSVDLAFRGEIRWIDVATPRRHITFDVRPTATLTTPYLHHQMRLYADGVVEFHYCDVVHGTTADTSRSVIGMQGGTPLVAITWAAFIRDSVQAGMGVRFTPR